jgi:hypothetical protein
VARRLDEIIRGDEDQRLALEVGVKKRSIGDSQEQPGTQEETRGIHLVEPSEDNFVRGRGELLCQELQISQERGGLRIESQVSITVTKYLR